VLDKPQTCYSDETSTGNRSEAFRGHGRATIAARATDDNDFLWLKRFHRDFLRDNAEMKSAPVLKMMHANPAADRFVRDNTGRATIVIVDLLDSYRQVLDPIYDLLGERGLTRDEILARISTNPGFKDVFDNLLRRVRARARSRTLVSKVESLFQDITRHPGAFAEDREFLVALRSLHEMKNKEFKEFVARFSVIFSNALAPDKRAEAIRKAWEAKPLGFVHEGYVAMVTLTEAVSANHVFDLGNIIAFEKLRTAHDKLDDALSAHSHSYLGERHPRGTLVQEDSRRFLGIQAADIAAGIASEIYQRFPEDRLAGAREVRRVFNRVLMNDRWIEDSSS
jgi:hypothetical protein